MVRVVFTLFYTDNCWGSGFTLRTHTAPPSRIVWRCMMKRLVFSWRVLNRVLRSLGVVRSLPCDSGVPAHANCCQYWSKSQRQPQETTGPVAGTRQDWARLSAHKPVIVGGFLFCYSCYQLYTHTQSTWFPRNAAVKCCDRAILSLMCWVL